SDYNDVSWQRLPGSRQSFARALEFSDALIRSISLRQREGDCGDRHKRKYVKCASYKMRGKWDCSFELNQWSHGFTFLFPAELILGSCGDPEEAKNLAGKESSA